MLILSAHRGEVGDRPQLGFITYKFTTEGSFKRCRSHMSAPTGPKKLKKSSWERSCRLFLCQHPVAVLLSGEVLRD